MRTTALPGGVTAIQDAIEVPGLGVLPCNAFLLRGEQPLLDRPAAPRRPGLPAQPRPAARHRRPQHHLLPAPLFDSPATTGFVDDLTGTVFTSDCFGAPMPSFELAGAEEVSEVSAADLEQGQRLWATVDAPWVSSADKTVFAAGLELLRALAPELPLSSHLPPATGRTLEFLDRLAALPGTAPFVGPDQVALEGDAGGVRAQSLSLTSGAEGAPGSSSLCTDTYIRTLPAANPSSRACRWT